MPEITAEVKLPPKLIPVFTNPARYRGAYGGRGSGKSYSFALMAAIRGYAEPLTILCAREFQNSIRDSVHAEITAAIRAHPWLEAHYDIGESYIKGKNGTSFIFKGLRHNYQQIKSTSGVNICWVEEAESTSEASWSVLIPTIRANGSEIWVTWNPESSDSATHKRFIINPPKDSIIVKLNHDDNPWFPQSLDADRIRDLERDPDYYAHVWEGEPITRTDAQIFAKKWRVESFAPGAGWDGPYHGLDFGFANDPTAAVKCWIYDQRLWVEYEAERVGLELDDTGAFIRDAIPGIEKYALRSDSARPESISYLQRHGLPAIIAAKKGPGSVEGGIKHLRSYREIVVHPRCTGLQRELRLYSYKVDRQSGDILPVIIDAHNHLIDALRYAIEPVMQAGGTYYGQPSAAISGGGSGFGNNLI
jgi:phage terminase large subunit